MLSIKRILHALIWVGTLGAQDQMDGSRTVEPSHVFVTDSLLTIERLLDDYPALVDAFHELSPEERAEFTVSIQALGDAFLDVFLEDISNT